MKTDYTQLAKKVKSLETDVKRMKRDMVDVDMVLTDDDQNALAKAERDLSAGKTKRL